MSGYLSAHGHTATVDLVVSNHRELYDRLQRLLSRDGASVESLAADYHAMVAGLSHRQYVDLRGINLHRVDFHGLVRAELAERALAAKQ